MYTSQGLRVCARTREGYNPGGKRMRFKPKTCDICGKTFQGSGSRASLCSRECKLKAKSQRNQRYKMSNPRKGRVRLPRVKTWQCRIDFGFAVCYGHVISRAPEERDGELCHQVKFYGAEGSDWWSVDVVELDDSVLFEVYHAGTAQVQ